MNKKNFFQRGKIWLVVAVVVFIGFFFARTIFAEDVTIWTANFRELPLTSNPSKCPSDMVWVPAGRFCIDKYEASQGGGSYQVDMNGDGDFNDTVNVYGDGTTWNESSTTQKAVSVSGANPWVSVTQVQAKAACLAAGKRLATNYELLLAAKGTPDPDTSDPGDDSEECNIWTNSKPSARTWVTENQAVKTMEGALCVSDAGAYDLVGNVWEWADNVISSGQHPKCLGLGETDCQNKTGCTWSTDHCEGPALPSQNYITSLDVYGLPVSTGSASSDYNNDYFWINVSGYRGFLRGGRWDGGAQAGVFALGLHGAPSGSGSSVGFRCAR